MSQTAVHHASVGGADSSRKLRAIRRPVLARFFCRQVIWASQMTSARRRPILGDMDDVTQILSRIDQGDRAAAEQLLPLVYDELRKLAASKMAAEKQGQTLQATALVHEAYVRIVAADPPEGWNGRSHFFGAAAEAMRRILIERARRKGRVRHGRDFRRIDLSDACATCQTAPDELLDLNDALARFEQIDPRRSQLVKLRFFAGLTIPEAAQAMGVSRVTAERYWKFARTWLYAEMKASSEFNQSTEE